MVTSLRLGVTKSEFLWFLVFRTGSHQPGLWLVETDHVTSVLASYWSVAAQLCLVIGHCAMCFSAPQSELLVKYLLSTGYGLDGKKTQDFHHHYQAGTDAVNDLFRFFALQIICCRSNSHQKAKLIGWHWYRRNIKYCQALARNPNSHTP